MTRRRFRVSLDARRGLGVLRVLSCLTVAAARPWLARVPSPLPSAREVIDRHVNAVGGKAALEGIHSRYVWGRYQFPARRLSGTVELYAARPNKRLLKIEYPDLGTEVTGFDGRVGWTSKPGEPPQLIVGSELALLRDQSVFDFDLHPDSVFRSMETTDLVDFQGRTCYRLRLVSVTGREWWEYYDVATGLFAGNQFREETSRGPVTVLTIVSEYRAFDGVRLPTKLSISAAGTVENVVVVRVRSNQVDGAVFQPPARLRASEQRPN
jgi:hypothetical protein